MTTSSVQPAAPTSAGSPDLPTHLPEVVLRRGKRAQRESVLARLESGAFGLLGSAMTARGRDITQEISQRSTLVLAPHPDDETLGCGATIMRKVAAGASVHVAVMTDGRRSHKSARIPPEALAELRRREALAACAALGVPEGNVHFIGSEDQRLDAAAKEAEGKLHDLIRAVAPGDILSASGIDRNPDHRALCDIVRRLHAAGRITCPVYEYPVWFWTAGSWSSPGTPVPVRLAQAVVRSAWAVCTMRPSLVRTDGLLGRKRAALMLHRSQVENLTGEAGWRTLDPGFIEQFFGRYEMFFPLAAGSPVADRIRVMHMLPDLHVGGGQHLLLRNLAGMDGARFEHHVCAVQPGGPMRADFERIGVRVHELGLRSKPAVPGAAWRLARLIREQHIDLIHTNNTGSDRTLGQLAAVLSRRPLVNTIHAEYARRPAPRTARAALKGLPRSLVRAGQVAIGRATIRHVVAVSERVRRSWEPMLGDLRLTGARVSVIYPGLDLARYAPPAPGDTRLAELRRAIAPEGAGPILMNVARLVRGKGQEHLMPLLREVRGAHPRCHLVLIGDGELRGRFESLARENGVEDAVSFLGVRDDVPELLGAADLFVFPSASEGFGLVVLEAMAASRPTAAFRLPSLEEFVGESAVMVPSGDVAALTREVLSLLADPERMRRMGRVGREIIEARFSQRACSDSLEDLYRSVLSGTRPVGRAASCTAGAAAAEPVRAASSSG